MKMKEKWVELDQSVREGESKVADAREKIKVAMEKLEKEKQEKKIQRKITRQNWRRYTKQRKL
jgi:predicted  nucleic acid-binding Zn-ribbon protein